MTRRGASKPQQVPQAPPATGHLAPPATGAWHLAPVAAGLVTPAKEAAALHGRRRRRVQGRERDRAVAAAAAGPKRRNVGLQQVSVFSRMPLGCDPWAHVYDVTH